MAKKNALGRGLGALIDDGSKPQKTNTEISTTISTSNKVLLSQIEVNPLQPRKYFDEEALSELSVSITQIGVVQPITVKRLSKNKFQLISGERRFRASKLADKKDIPAYIVDASNDQAILEMALVENIQREDLDAIEIAISYQRLIDECKLTQEKLSERIGKKRSTITNYLRLLKLPGEIQLGIQERKITMGHARALVNIKSQVKQLNLYNKILEEHLSVRNIEDLARGVQDKETKKDELPKKEKLVSEYIDLKNHLSSFFDTNIQFKRDNKGKGSIVIPFKSDDELEQLIAIFDKLNR